MAAGALFEVERLGEFRHYAWPRSPLPEDALLSG
jgi:hypothetical protein